MREFIDDFLNTYLKFRIRDVDAIVGGDVGGRITDGSSGLSSADRDTSISKNVCR